MDSIPGDPSTRLDRVQATAQVSLDMWRDKWRHLTSSVILIAIGNDTRPTCKTVARYLVEALCIEPDQVRVSIYHPEGYFAEFSMEHICTAALALQLGLRIGGTTLKVMPWTAMSHAKMETLHYKVRLCVEGIPPHAQNIDTVAGLLGPTVLVERLDTMRWAERDLAGYCV